MKTHGITRGIALAALAAALTAGADTNTVEGTNFTYTADWKSLDKRPVADWWQDAKFGIFIHWGPYSVPAYAKIGKYAEWYESDVLGKKGPSFEHQKAYYGGAPYGNFAADFKARFFDAKKWAQLFKDAGAKYVVLTSKHHDGYALWPSPESPYYNSTVLGSGRDLAKEFADAMKEAGLKRGFYFSLIEFANPLFKAAKNEKRVKDWARAVNLPQMKELVTRYQPDVVWPDGDWVAGSADWLSEEFLAWLFNESPVKDTVVVNDRWGSCRGKHGGHYTTEYGNLKRKAGKVHPWEECRGIGASFGFNRFETPSHYMSRTKCVETLVQAVSGGGNLLLNVGPDADGIIPPIQQDRILAMGAWLKVNGEAIYGTRKPSEFAEEDRVYTTGKGGTLYAIDFRLDGQPFTVKGLGKVSSVKLLGSDVKVDYTFADGTLTVKPPLLPVKDQPCEHAWTYGIERD